MRIAVLGATGVAGRTFVPRAAAAGHSLVTDRIDILDRQAVTSLLRGCEAVVNLATSIGNWEMNDRIRREGTANLIAASIDCRTKVVVQQSVAMLHCVADDRPQSEDDSIEGYGVLASAYDMETLLRGAAIGWRIVRGAFFYGPGTLAEERWLEHVRDPGFRIPDDGSAWISLIHIDDFAEAVLFVLEHGKSREAYIACDDRPWRLRELYERIASGAGLPTPPTGGNQPMRSFRVTNAKLRGVGWRPLVSRLS